MPSLSLSEDIQLTGHHGTPATCKCTWDLKGEQNKVEKRGLPTVHNNFYNAEINLAPGHESSLARVRALIRLFYAADL